MTLTLFILIIWNNLTEPLVRFKFEYILKFKNGGEKV